jgi:hypothetical protein
VIEIERGWFFRRGKERIGSKGLIVNKDTGRIFVVPSLGLLERDLHMYDRGMDARHHEVVIIEIVDLDATVAFVKTLGPRVVEMSYEHGTVWRSTRPLTEDEIRARLADLPAIFPEMELYGSFEAVEEARANKCCVMDLLPRPD